MVIAIIVGCFAILYPKMFHPMLMFVLGLNKKEQREDESRQLIFIHLSQVDLDFPWVKGRGLWLKRGERLMA